MTPVDERPDRSEEEILRWLKERVATATALPPEAVDVDGPLLLLPIDSLTLAGIQEALEDWLRRPIPDETFLEAPTLSAVASSIWKSARCGGPSATGPADADGLLVALRPPRPLFVLGGSPGKALYQRPLAHAVGAPFVYYAVQLPGHDGREAPLATAEDIAARCLSSVRCIQAHGPYLLGGHSFGGLLAYEMACQLMADGEEVAAVMLFDACLLTEAADLSGLDDATVRAALMRTICLCEDLSLEPGVIAGGDAIERRLAQFLESDASRWADQLEALVPVYRASLTAMGRYVPERAAVPLILFKAVEGFPASERGRDRGEILLGSPDDRAAASVRLALDDPTYGWDGVTRSTITVRYVPGNHYNLFNARYAPTLGAVLRDCLRESAACR